MALRTAFGRMDSTGATRRIATIAMPAAERPPTCDVPPARSTAAVLDRLPATPRPPNRPEPILALPAAMSSWSVSSR
jgi:hypothetical protein